MERQRFVATLGQASCALFGAVGIDPFPFVQPGEVKDGHGESLITFW